MILVALLASLTTVGAFIRIPVPPVAFTMQIFFVIFAGLLLGAKLGALSQLIYIALGLAGLPVFANGGGIQYIFNPTFGYLIGFVAAAFVAGFISEKVKKPTFLKYLGAAFVGLILIYAIGVPYMYLMLKYVNGMQVSASGLVVKGFLIFLPWDMVKIIVVAWISKKISHVRVMKPRIS
jgi:biotin transport system substrate-specific component